MINAIYQAIKDLLKLIQTLAKWPLAGVAAIIILFIFCMLGHLAYLRIIKKVPVKQGEHKVILPPSILKRIFWDLPKRWAADQVAHDPDEFPYNGLYIFCGPQGSGKTSAMAYMTRKIQNEYPKCKVLSNMYYKYQDYAMTDQHDIINCKNGKYGLIVQLDEITTQFSSLQSKNFPPELMEAVCQQRKQRKALLCTAQNQERCSKPIREQTKYIIKCYTLFGCLTIMHKISPVLIDGELKEEKSRGQSFFVHDAKLRYSFDTYRVIESLVKSGFKDNADILSNAEPSKTEINYYDMSDNKKKK